MIATEEAEETADTAAELVRNLGGIPLHRIRIKPPPGNAKEDDVLRAEAEPRKRLCELIDGVLVEKAKSVEASFLAIILASQMAEYCRTHNLGIVLGADGMLRLWPGRVRIPDIAFISWDRLPDRSVPRGPMLEVAPDLAVEVLSPSNTKAEMKHKRQDYFKVGIRLFWIIDPEKETVEAYTNVDAAIKLSKRSTLDGGDVLPGFKLKLAELFGELDRRG